MSCCSDGPMAASTSASESVPAIVAQASTLVVSCLFAGASGVYAFVRADETHETEAWQHIGLSVLLVGALVSVSSGIGMVWRPRWSWWGSLVTNVAWGGVAAAGVHWIAREISAYPYDVEGTTTVLVLVLVSLLLTVPMSFVAVVCLLVPPVRRRYLARR